MGEGVEGYRGTEREQRGWMELNEFRKKIKKGGLQKLGVSNGVTFEYVTHYLDK